MISNLIELTYNLALPVAMSMLSGFIRQRREGQVRRALWQGVLFGLAAVIGMMRPLVLGPGLIFDGRSVMVSLCGLFFGPLAAGLAGGMALLYRFTLGGAGVHTGGLVITSSALLGVLFHRLWDRPGAALTPGRLLGFGLLVHGAMVLLMFTLPAGAGLGVIRQLGLPILLAYPMVTLLIGQILAAQEAKIRAVEALSESEAKYRMLTESMQDVVWTLDTQTFRFLYVSPSVQKLRGFTPAEILAEPVDAALMPETADALQALIRQRVAIFQSMAKAPDLSYTEEVEQPCKDGSRVWTEVVTTYRLNASTGHVEVLGVTRNITKRKQAEGALLQNERKFRTLFESLTEGVALHELVRDPTGTVLDYRMLEVNPAYEMHTGLKAANTLGRLGSELYGTEVPPYLAQFSKVALGGEPYAFETFFPPLEKHFRILVISPREGQFATVFEDITGRKALETYQLLSHEVLQILVKPGDFLTSLQRVLTAMKTQTALDAVGIRLQAGDDFPYSVQEGFPTALLLPGNTLTGRDADGGVRRDEDGNDLLECLSGMVLAGKADPTLPLFTVGGSAWTSDAGSLSSSVVHLK